MEKFSKDSYCRLALALPDGADKNWVQGYSALSDDLLAAEELVARWDPASASTLNRALCRFLREKFTLEGLSWDLPVQFQQLYEQQLSRIDHLLVENQDSYFRLGNDSFRKDLALLRHRLIPFGAEFATPFSGVSRSLMFRGGWRQAGKFLKVLVKCPVTSPFLELHMHPQYTSQFNPEGWVQTYENLADFLSLNQALRGVQSTSWFLDPALKKISPHLSYLREVPERCGAVFFFAGEDDPRYSGAFVTSRSRRALHESGQYHPRLYTRIWPRRKLLERRWRLLAQ